MVRYALLLLTVLPIPASSAASGPAAASIKVPVELRGSPASMKRQNAAAVESGVSFARTFEDIDRKLEAGELVRLLGNEHYDLRDGLSSNAARPEMRLFVERLAEEYFETTGEKLVVTSLTRPVSAQPGNAHALSIHPTGLAVDLRISQQAASRKWIEGRLLQMEAAGLLDVTRENYPPHYHLALFPQPYLTYVEGLIGTDALTAALRGETEEDRIEEEIFEQDLVQAALIVVEAAPARRSLWSFITGLFGRRR